MTRKEKRTEIKKVTEKMKRMERQINKLKNLSPSVTNKERDRRILWGCKLIIEISFLQTQLLLIQSQPTNGKTV